MAKPRVFLSSTFYDLRQIRTDIDTFIDSLGYEPVRNEEGDIPYGKEEALEEYCYKEIKSVDVVISIIGGRFGSESKRAKSSISQIELKTALKEGKQIYIFIEKNVHSEYETYILNKEKSKDIKFRYVDDVRIYEFIEEIKSLNINNNLKEFETASDIVKYLREQFAGLFQRFLQEQTRIKEVSLISNLEKTAQTLNKLVNFLSDENKGQAEEINRILTVSHPLVETLSSKLEIPYNFYIEAFYDLGELLSARGFRLTGSLPFDFEPEDEEFHVWTKDTKNRSTILKLSKHLFDENDKLIFIKKSDWNEKWVTMELRDTDKRIADDGLPF